MALDAGILMFSCMVAEEFSVNNWTKKWHIFLQFSKKSWAGLLLGGKGSES